MRSAEPVVGSEGPVMPVVRRVTTGDLFNFWAEGSTSPMQIALAGIFQAPQWLDETGRVRLSCVAEQIDRRTRRAGLLRRRIRWTHVGEGRPVWVDDADFAITRHVETEHIDALSPERLWEWAAQQAIRPLDRRQPLWRLVLVSGLPGGEVGMVFVIHHVAVDGMAGVSVLSALLDASPDEDVAAEWEPQPIPRAGQLVWENLTTKLRAVPPALRALPHLPILIRAFRGTLAAVREEAPITSLAGRIGHQRHAAVISVPLDQVQQAAHAETATVNDLVLSATTTGLREWLAGRNELDPGMALRASMPIAVRGRQQNAGRMVVVSLPVGEADPRRRLAAITETTTALKSSHADVAHSDITGSPLFPVSLMRLGIPWLARRGGLKVNCFVTNVRGPGQPLYLAGAPFELAAGLSPLVAGVRLGVTVFSYAGVLTITLLGDGLLPDWPALVSSTRRAVAELART
jgi:WS/DGAT/MGAT family acyltransferase